MINKIKELIKKYSMFIKYIIVAGISFGIDISLFTIFNTVIGIKIIAATVGARIISSFINYLLNKDKVFKSEENTKSTIIKYYILVVIQMFTSAFLVNTLCNFIHINPTFIKIPVEFILFICNYLIQKLFIFNKREINIKYKNILYSILSLISVYSYFNLLSINKYLIFLIEILLFILLIVYYKFLCKDLKLSKKYHILSFIISFILVLGYSYQIKHTSILFFGSIKNFAISMIKVFGYYYFINVLIFNIIRLLEYKFKASKNKLINSFSKHPFLYSFIFLSLCYSVYLICYYPGIINYDNANQIKEVLGLHTRYLDAINPISNSTLTNFNPIIHTLVLGGLVKFGLLFNNFNFGLFLYTILQMFICIIIYSYCLSYAVKHKINPNYSFIILLILGIIPTFGFYSITAVKDTLYTAFLVLFSLKVYDFMIKDSLNIKDYLSMFLISMSVCLLRNNGFFVVIFTLPFLYIKKQKLYNTLTILLIILSYMSFNNILLPSLGISGTSIRETLSVPFQQTARMAKYYPEAFSNKDKKIINKILDYDNLAKDYNEDLADNVKNKYNKDATNKDLINYFKVWGKGLIKYPMVYVDATINNITGYFYPFEGSWKVYHNLNPKLPEAGYDYHFNDLKWGRDILHSYHKAIEYTPIGLFLNIGIISWLSILVFIMLCNKNKYYIFMIPNIISLLFCILSPANTYYRYIYPSLVIMVCLFPVIKYVIENKYNKKLKR